MFNLCVYFLTTFILSAAHLAKVSLEKGLLISISVVTHRLLTHDVNGAHVAAAHPQQAVQRAALAVQAGAVAFDLAAAVQHDLRAEREVLHQHPPVVHHLALALAAHDEALARTHTHTHLQSTPIEMFTSSLSTGWKPLFVPQIYGII